jgi:hypothetical protein
MSDKPEADVLCWDAHSFRVLCPHCGGIHRHGMSGMDRNGPKTRVPHCKGHENYVYCFPINDQGQVAYEIDKTRAQFVNICASRDTAGW